MGLANLLSAADPTYAEATATPLGGSLGHGVGVRPHGVLKHDQEGEHERPDDEAELDKVLLARRVSVCPMRGSCVRGPSELVGLAGDVSRDRGRGDTSDVMTPSAINSHATAVNLRSSRSHSDRRACHLVTGSADRSVVKGALSRTISASAQGWSSQSRRLLHHCAGVEVVGLKLMEASRDLRVPVAADSPCQGVLVLHW